MDNKYLEAQVMTAPPHRLHLMVVDGAIRFALRAEQALADGDFETAHLSLNRSRRCVSELIGGLDAERAPELVARLKSLFLFAYRDLVDADLHRDLQRIHNALRVLRLHRDTWVALGGKLLQEQQEAPPGPAEGGWTT